MFLSSYKLLMTFDFSSVPLRGENGLCPYCGEAMKKTSVDHIVPRSRGGVQAGFNLAECCPSCNSRKNGESPVTWLMKMGHLMSDRVREELTARILYHQLVAPVMIDISQATAGGRIKVLADRSRQNSKYHGLREGSEKSSLCGLTQANGGKRPWAIELVDQSVIDSPYFCQRCRKILENQE